MLKPAAMLERGLYQPALGKWRPARRCHRLLRTAYQCALQRENLERKNTKLINGAEAFRTIFGRDPQNPGETTAIATPFGIIFIVSQRDYEGVIPYSFSDGHYLLAAHEQDKILPVEYKERVALASTRRHAYRNEPFEAVIDIARHEYEHMCLATTAFGRQRKNFADEILTLAGSTAVVQVRRLWDGSYTPQPTLEDIMRKAQAALEWWKEAFLEAIVKDELIAHCSQHLPPDKIEKALSFLINHRFTPKFFSELDDFVALHAQQTFGLSQRTIDCISQFRADWDQVDVASFQRKAGDAGVATIHDGIKAGIPLRVILEVSHRLALREWPRRMPEVLGLN